MIDSRLAVLGSPIAHSLSPVLHSAAYRELGLDWSYEAIEVTADRLPAFLESTSPASATPGEAPWRGLSLTMPLKRDVVPLLDERDELVELTGGANTVVFSTGDDGSRRLSGYNTDVFGVVEALRSGGVTVATTVQLLGAGATAASVVVAVASIGATRLLISTRSAEKAEPVARLARELGVDVTVAALDARLPNVEPDLVISTLPGGTEVEIPFADQVIAGATLFDVAYSPWPTTSALRWLTAGGRVIPGLEMLASQALAQVRLFVGGDAATELDGEARVKAAMRASVGLG